MEAAGDVRAAWPELAERVRSTFVERDDVDTCVRVRLRMREGTIELEVSLADGRSASRVVQREQDVIPTLEALLVVPRRVMQTPEAGAEVAAEPEPDSEPAPELPRPAKRAPVRRLGWIERERATPERENEHSPDRLGIELALVTGAGIGEDHTGVSLGVSSLVDVSSWLAGFRVRGSEYMSESPTTFATSSATLELAALGGRRVPLESLAIDLLAGPALAMEAGSTNDSGPADGEHEDVTPRVVPRLVVASRLNLAPRSVLRGFLGIEGELGPSGADSTSGSFELPVWMVGVSLGAAVGTR